MLTAGTRQESVRRGAPRGVVALRSIPPAARARRPRSTRHTRADRERGSVAVFTVVFAIAVVFLTALILDGGVAMNAKERAANIAEQAARAAADNIDITALRNTGVAAIGPGACPVADNVVRAYAAASTGVDAVTSATMDSCAVVAANTATVQVTITTRPLIPGVLSSFTETARASATAECGVNQGVAC
jgi:Flp pilus assembly protein TadG